MLIQTIEAKRSEGDGLSGDAVLRRHSNHVVADIKKGREYPAFLPVLKDSLPRLNL